MCLAEHDRDHYQQQVHLSFYLLCQNVLLCQHFTFTFHNGTKRSKMKNLGWQRFPRNIVYLHVCVHWYNEIHVNPCHKRRRTMRMEKANRTRFFLFLTSLLETSLFQLDVPSLMMDVGRHSRRKYFCRPRSGSNYFGCVDCRSSEEIFSG